VKYAYPRFSEILRKHYGSHGSPGNHFSTMWRSLPPICFLLKQPNFQNVLEGPRFELLFTPLSWSVHPPPIFVFLAVFFPKSHETLRIPQRWVLNILRWSNEGRMPTNNGPQTKLGYDSSHRERGRHWVVYILEAGHMVGRNACSELPQNGVTRTS